MAVGPVRFFTAVSGPEDPLHEVGMIRRREQRQPIDASVLANPVADGDVIRMDVFGKARSLGLLGCKEPLLALGDLIEPSMCFYARFGHAQYYDLIEVLCKPRNRRNGIEQTKIRTPVPYRHGRADILNDTSPFENNHSLDAEKSG